MPDPRQAAYGEALEHWIGHFWETPMAVRSAFTNHRGMQQVPSECAIFRKSNHLLGARCGSPRGKLLDQFKTNHGSVLLTDIFGWASCPWRGASNVIITRLPFAVPDHPLVEAKLELIEEARGDPFTNIRCRKRS